jgi:hypothetical protein
VYLWLLFLQVLFLDETGQPLHSAAELKSSTQARAASWEATPSGPVSKPSRPNKSKKIGKRPGGKQR